MSWSNFSGEAEAGTVIKWEKLLRSMGASAGSAGFCHCLHILALREEFGELPTEQLLDKAAGHFISPSGPWRGAWIILSDAFGRARRPGQGRV